MTVKGCARQAFGPQRTETIFLHRCGRISHAFGDEALDTQGVWNRNYSTFRSFWTEVEDVLRDQAKRGQVLILPESEAKNRFPNLVVASFGAQKKENLEASSRLVYFLMGRTETLSTPQPTCVTKSSTRPQEAHSAKGKEV